MIEDTRRLAEEAARNSYGKLLSMLASRSRDIASSEDALAEAFTSALQSWPENGVPGNPDAWLLTAARNALLNMKRHVKMRGATMEDLERHYDELTVENELFEDERLKLLFVCAHPAIDAAARTPLMLQTVIGLDAAQIASAFLIAPAAMSQRLVRAKTKIKQAGIKFQIPEQHEIEQRLNDVLNAIYAAFGTGWDAVRGAQNDDFGLTKESIYLGRLLIKLLPAEPEAKGLLSLMLFCEARRASRFGNTGIFIPLKEQDTKLWNRTMIIEADQLLIEASKSKQFGRYQCEAAIQSVHAQRPITGETNYAALMTLYKMLAIYNSSIGVLVGQAAIYFEMGDKIKALELLDQIKIPEAKAYQPYWVLRANCLLGIGSIKEGKEAAKIAIGLTDTPAIKKHLSKLIQNAAQ
jgi:RNA polymerase sigma-70 factor, ECF subfamily